MQLYSSDQSTMGRGFHHLLGQAGFTLFELIIAMAIVATVLSIAVWSVASWIPDIQLNRAARSLKSDMHAARMTAIHHNTYVVSEFDITHNSYVIYVDNGDGDVSKAHNYVLDAGEATIKAVRLNHHLNMIGAQFGAVLGKLAFNSRGAIDGLSGGIYMTNKNNTFRGVTVSRIGKISVKASDDGRTWQRIN